MAQAFQTSTANIRPTPERRFVSDDQIAKWNNNKFPLRRGSWQAGTTYLIGESVERGGNLYEAKDTHTSGSTFEMVHWTLVLAGGTVADGQTTRAKLDAQIGAKVDTIDVENYQATDYAEVHTDLLGKMAFFVDLAGRLGTPGVPDITGSILALREVIQDMMALFPDDVPADGYAEVHIDQAKRIAYFVDLAGKLGTPGVPDITGAILGLQYLQNFFQEGSEASGYLLSMTDPSKKVALGLDLAGTLILKGERIYDLFAPLAGYNALSRQITPGRDTVCAGDSLTESGWPALFSSLMADGRIVTNKGRGGDSSTQVAFRLGAISVGLSITGNQIPSSGSVAVTPSNQNIMQVSYSVTGRMFGVAGTLNRAANGAYSFIRTTPGAAVLTDKVSMFTVDAAGFDYQTAVIWAGRNNAGDPATVLADIAAMVGFLKPVNKRFVVISVLNGNYPGESIGGDGYDKIVNQINAKLRERYPNNYLDVREMLIRNYNSAQPGDVTDANNDVPPRSLRSDEVHLNEAGKALVAQTVKNFFTQNNW